MKEFWNFIQMVFMAVGGWLGWFMGGCDGLLYALIAFVVIDYLIRVMCAFADIRFPVSGIPGICREGADLSAGGNSQYFGCGCDQERIPSVLRTAVIFFYISNEV